MRPGGDCVSAGIACDLEDEVVAVVVIGGIRRRVVAALFTFVVGIVSFEFIVNGSEGDRLGRCALARWNDERGQRYAVATVESRLTSLWAFDSKFT